eukprot:2947820-Amphidinium_carterae.1
MEIREFYVGFEVYNFNNAFNPNKPINEDEGNSTMLQQLLSISYTYAPTFFESMKLQNMNYLRQQGFGDIEIQTKEADLRLEEIQELYIILAEKTLQQWMKTCTIPASYIDNGTDNRHS